MPALRRTVILILCLLASVASADDAYTLRAARPGLYFMDFPHSGSKSTIVELDTFVVMIDLPIRDEGGDGAIADDVAGGEHVLRTLAAAFPTKPLRYLVASHWHPHSLSALSPFVHRGVALITTEANYRKQSAMLGVADRAAAARLATFVGDVPLTIRDGARSLVIRRVLAKDYASMPTEDYLYVELPAQHALYTGCMFERWHGAPVLGRELVTNREADVWKFVRDRGLHPAWIFGLTREPAPGPELVTAAAVEREVRTGVTEAELTARYRALGTDELHRDRAHLLDSAAHDGVPAWVVNGLVYEALEHHDLDRALELATFQALLGPATANAWDTLGEVHFMRGELDIARACGRQSKHVDAAGDGGEVVWAADLVRYRRGWAAVPPAH